MTDYKRKKMRTPFRLFVLRIVRHWPLYMWIVAIGASALLYLRTSQFGGMQGVGETLEEAVAPLESARLQEIFVTVGQHVRAGDPIAQMDTVLFDARMVIEDARLLEAENSLSAYQQDVARIMRGFNDTLRSAEAALEAERAAFNRDKARLDALKIEYGRRENLRERHLLGEMDAAALRPEIASLEQAVASYPVLMQLREQRVRELAAQQADLYDWLKIDAGGLLSDAVKEALKVRELITQRSAERRQLQRETYTLRATRDGLVSRIYFAPGSVVSAGTPVALIVPEETTRVVGFLPEVYHSQLQIGQEVMVSRLQPRMEAQSARVESISPEIRSLPGRVSPIRDQPLRGRRVIMQLQDGASLIPGESVRISLPLLDGWF